jgi:hypothetical protein
MNEENISKRFKQSDEAFETFSDQHSSLLQDVKDRLDENNLMIKAATSEAKGLGSKLDE